MFDDETENNDAPAEESAETSTEGEEGGEEDASEWGLEDDDENLTDMASAMAAMSGEGKAEETLPPPEKTPAQIEKEKDLERFGDIDLDVSILLGKAYMPVEQFLKIGRGAIIELEETKHDDVRIHVNGVEVGKGEININDDRVNIMVKTMAYKNKMYAVE